MSIDPKLETLLKSFVDLCDCVVEDAYVVTDGVNIAGICLMESLAHHICRKIISKSHNPEEAGKEWVVTNFPNALKYAKEKSFKEGYDEACKEIMNYQKENIEKCEEVFSGEEKLAQETTESDDEKNEISFDFKEENT